MPMEFASAPHNVRARWADRAWKELGDGVSASARRETGGVLVGSYHEHGSLAIISSATSPPTDSRAGRAWFHRGIAGLKPFFRRALARGEHYIGEWHFHPGAAPEPSPTDIEQLRKLALEPGGARSPLLAIIGGDARGMHVSMSIIIDGEFVRLDPPQVPHAGPFAEERGPW